MMLTPTEIERLTIFTAAELARRRKARGLKLNHPEAVAYLSDTLIEAARDGDRSLAELMAWGSTLLSTDDVLPAVRALIPILLVEGHFEDGAKLITVHDPIRPGREAVADTPASRPGEILTEDGEIELNAGRRKATLSVLNTADRPIQVASHYHFFEANKALDFDRAAAFGMRLDVAAGLTARFEPGESKRVTLVAFGGSGEVTGLNGLTEGSVFSDTVRAAALERARELGYRGA